MLARNEGEEGDGGTNGKGWRESKKAGIRERREN
jgi:hypothetical protein